MAPAAPAPSSGAAGLASAPANIFKKLNNCLFDHLNPGSGMGKKSGSRSEMNNVDHISECLETIFWGLTYLKFFDADPGWKKIGSGIKARIRNTAFKAARLLASASHGKYLDLFALICPPSARLKYMRFALCKHAIISKATTTKLICKCIHGHGHTTVANPNLIHLFFFIFKMKTFE